MERKNLMCEIVIGEFNPFATNLYPNDVIKVVHKRKKNKGEKHLKVVQHSKKTFHLTKITPIKILINQSKLLQHTHEENCLYKILDGHLTNYRSESAKKFCADNRGILLKLLQQKCSKSFLELENENQLNSTNKFSISIIPFLTRKVLRQALLEVKLHYHEPDGRNKHMNTLLSMVTIGDFCIQYLFWNEPQRIPACTLEYCCAF